MLKGLELRRMRFTVRAAKIYTGVEDEKQWTGHALRDFCRYLARNNCFARPWGVESVESPPELRHRRKPSQLGTFIGPELAPRPTCMSFTVQTARQRTLLLYSLRKGIHTNPL